jgi:hypothetical protein
MKGGVVGLRVRGGGVCRQVSYVSNNRIMGLHFLLKFRFKTDE